MSLFPYAPLREELIQTAIEIARTSSGKGRRNSTSEMSALTRGQNINLPPFDTLCADITVL